MQISGAQKREKHEPWGFCALHQESMIGNGAQNPKVSRLVSLSFN